MKTKTIFTFLLQFIFVHLALSQQAKEYYLDHDGDQIFVKEMGSGQPLVFLHGGPADNHMSFLPYAESLAEHFRVILYDQNDAGKSKSATSKPHTVEREVETLEFIRQELGIEKLSIVGHSWGTILSLFYAKQHPENVNKVMLVASIGTSFQYYMRFAQNLQGKFTQADMLKMQELAQKPGAGPQDQLEVYLPYYFHDQVNSTKLTKTLVNFEVNREIMGDVSRLFHFKGQGAEFNLPIMVLQGASDMLTVTDLKEAFKGFPNVQFTEARQSGHFPFVEEPALTTQTILKFFQ